jgi:hypothetical protein
MTPSVALEQVRDIPLEQLLTHHGLPAKREGATVRYKNDQFNIVVSNGGLWFDNAASVGGRGAIDLLLHLKWGVSPRTAAKQKIREAIAWLTDFRPSGFVVPEDAAISSPRPRPESFSSQAARLAIPDDGRWPLARSYLVHSRRLPGHRVDALHDRGDIYASFSQNRPEATGVCFAHRDLAGEIRGATIRAATDGVSSHFSIGEKQGAWFTLGNPDQASRAVLVEAPIDAISYLELNQPHDTVILSVSGSNATRPLLEAAHQRRWELALGFDNNQPGHAGWKHCFENYTRLYPEDPPPCRTLPEGKDWNDDLRGVPRQRHGRRL